MSNPLPETSTVDYQLENHGSIYLLRPLNQECLKHLQDNVSDEAIWWGGGESAALVVEPRYLENLVNLLADNGFYYNC